MTTPELLPCPFCGGGMEDRGYGAVHLFAGKCPLGDLAIDVTRWNTRAPLSPAEAPEVRDQWQPIETAPKDGRDMLLWHPQFGILMGHWDHVGTSDWWAVYAWPQPMHSHPCEGWFSPFMESDGVDGVDPTHWMPLPAPPAAIREGRT